MGAGEGRNGGRSGTKITKHTKLTKKRRRIDLNHHSPEACGHQNVHVEVEYKREAQTCGLQVGRYLTRVQVIESLYGFALDD